MQKNLAVSSSPHLRDNVTTRRIMQEVCLALAPAGIAAIVLFGASAATLIAVSVITAVLAEFCWNKLNKQKTTVGDWSAVVTGLLLAYNLPANAPVWIAAVGAIIAIILVKQMFGGIGSNFMNPALAARAILFVSWSSLMTSYPATQFMTDVTSSATPLNLLGKGTVEGVNLMDLFLGNVPGVLGGDGEELDVYVLGVSKPVQTFDGRVIGIVHRQDDNEDKLVAAPDGRIFDQAQIAQQVYFQEKYYHSEVEPLYHHSCGVIPFRRGEKGFEYLLLLQRESNTWSFPKGHQERGENERETVLREAWEETGCRARLLDGFREEITYAMEDRKGQKRVTLVLGRLEGELSLREEEIAAARWMSAEEALPLLHKGYRTILDKAEEFLSKQG